MAVVINTNYSATVASNNLATSNTMLQRANFASTVLSSLRTLPSAARAHDRLLDGVLGPGTVQELNSTRDDRSRWFAVFASPEFQLK